MSKEDAVLRIAAVQFSLEQVASSAQYWGRIESLVAGAAQRGADVVVFPEYASLSLIVAEADAPTFQDRLRIFARDRAAGYVAQTIALAEKYGTCIISGSIPWLGSERAIVNRAFIGGGLCVSRDDTRGMPLAQDKIRMTRFEAEKWGIVGDPEGHLKVFTIGKAKCAVTICYDVEFPEITAMAARAGVDVLFVPSCTDDVQGYWRVRHCAHARTVENQCYAVVASVVSGDARFPEMDSHFGQAAILSPCDGAFPERGVVAEGLANTEAIVCVDVDLDLLAEARRNGTVRNLRDRMLDGRPAEPPS